jgi:hypothetical protein
VSAAAPPRRRVGAVLVLALLAQALAAGLAGAAAAAGPVAGSGVPGGGYQPPVPLEVVRPFDAPSHAYGPGHRGVKLRARPGDPVRAAAPGTVVHAGAVAGTVWVSVDHADGVRTSYGPLDDLRVSAGDHVRAASVLGVLAPAATDGLHWGARYDGAYLDPLALLGPTRVASLVGDGGWRATDHAVTAYERWRGAWLGGFGLHPSERATRAGYALPPNPNHLVLVRGLNSATDSAMLDADHLGYDPASVTDFSYAGTDADGAPLPYGPADTWDGIDVAARRLADQLRAQHRRQPGRPVDLVGHSQGGLVILRYLTAYHDAYDPTLPGIGSVVTLSTPHRGSDTATLSRSARDHSVLGGLVSAGTFLADPREQAFRGATRRPLDELRVGSPFLRGLSHDWRDAVEAGPGGQLAMGTRVLTVGGASDRIVGTHRAALPGPDADPKVVAGHRVLPGNHDGILHTEAVREVVHDFLAGREVTASPAHLQTAISWLHGDTQRYLGHGLQLHDLTLGPRQALRAARTPGTVAGR